MALVSTVTTRGLLNPNWNACKLSVVLKPCTEWSLFFKSHHGKWGGRRLDNNWQKPTIKWQILEDKICMFENGQHPY